MSFPAEITGKVIDYDTLMVRLYTDSCGQPGPGARQYCHTARNEQDNGGPWMIELCDGDDRPDYIRLHHMIVADSRLLERNERVVLLTTVNCEFTVQGCDWFTSF